MPARVVHQSLGAESGILIPPDRTRRPRRADGGTGPPSQGGGGGGHGGGGWSDDGWFDEPEEDEPSRPRGAARPAGTAELGFWFVLTSIATLFLVFLGAYLVLRQNASVWPPPGSPGPPRGLWWSTLILAFSDVAMTASRRAHGRGATQPARRWLLATTALAFAFLVVQAVLWRGVLAAGMSITSDAYGIVFFSLTGLHAVHVVAGVVFLGWVCATAWRRRLDDWAIRLKLASLYWHTLNAIWLVLFVVLYYL